SLYRADVVEALEYDDFRYDPLLVLRVRPLNPPSLRNLPVFYRRHYLLQAIIGCQCMTSYALWRAKLLMCPVAMDMTPAYSKRNDRHYWTVIADDDRIVGEKETVVRLEKFGKIYRRTFSRQPLPIPEKREHVPFFFQNPFYRDVTRHYGLTSDVTIPAPKSLSVANAYLCVFNDLQWKPVVWASKEKGRFRFKDMGRDIVYLPVAYPNGREVPISCPVVLYSSGKMEVLRPDTTRLLTLRLDRKYPQSYVGRPNNQSFTNVLVEASDNPRFHRADSLGVFGTISLRQWTSAPIASSRAYRYWRLRASQVFVFGECLLYDDSGNRIVPDRESEMYNRMAFDDDPLSYAFSDASNTLAIDMGRPVSLSRVECLLRNDGNTVWPGHWYELLYHDGVEWHSLGVKEAEERWVEFEKVPSGALLWLRDLTEGKQERIFTVTDNRVRFW
ncbi:MAG: discoidin domain-containing protein, partial [Odoribacter sp.]|nr:discoidin domain-containing protein [Odoribacter sp.]